MKKFPLSILLTTTTLIGCLTTLPALSANLLFQLDATLTADNHYRLFVGNRDGSKLLNVGRNEVGPFNIPDTISPIPNEICPDDKVFNWGCPESFSVKIPSEYIFSQTIDNINVNSVNVYVAVWGDPAVEDTLLGEFKLLDCNCLTNQTEKVTDTTWQVAVSEGNNPKDFGNISLKTMLKEIAIANTNNKWQPAVSLGFNDGTTFPWGETTSNTENAHYLAQPNFNNQRSTLNEVTLSLPISEEPCKPISEPSVIFGLLTLGAWGMVFTKKKG